MYALHVSHSLYLIQRNSFTPETWAPTNKHIGYADIPHIYFENIFKRENDNN